MKSVALHNLGCKVNSYELDVMQQYLQNKGYKIVNFNQKADIYIINTCTVTNIADRKSRQMLHRAKKQNPDAIVVAVGCYVQTNEAEIEKDDCIDLAIGNNRKNELVEIIEAYLDKRQSQTPDEQTAASSGKMSGVAPDKTLGHTSVIDINAEKEYEEMQLVHTAEHTRAYIKIQDGCNQFCSYCIIPYVRGRIRSRSQEAILAEVSELAEAGIKEVVLTGIHISSYGKDKNNEGALIELIEAISKIKGIKRIRLGSLEPGIITEEFVERISSNSKVCPHFHLSLQSGCDSVLKRMNRKYTCKQYFEKCDMLRKAYKSPALTTDVIVGFPGETEEEFAETVRYLTELNLYEMHIFKYSPRKGTVAAAMKEQVAPEIKNERSDVLLKLAHDNKTAYEAQFEGCELEVLVEEVVKKDNKTYLRGHTERYMDILIDVGDISMPESFVNSFVYVTYTQNGGNLPLLL